MKQNKHFPKRVKLTGDALLLKICNVIKREPKRVHMEEGVVVKDHRRAKFVSEFPACDTVGCIAGWACLLSDGLEKFAKEDFYWGNMQNRANTLLEFPDNFYPSNLFYVENWPLTFNEAYNATKAGSKERANVVIARIKHYIANRQ